MNASVRLITDRQLWQDLAASHPSGHLLQSWEWGELKARFGWRVVRLGWAESGRLVAGAQVLLRPVPPAFSVAYVPKGPLVDWRCPSQLPAVLSDLHRMGRAWRSVFLKIEPNAPDDPALAVTLGQQGFVCGASVQPARTILLDLSGDEDTTLAAMRQKTRYNIRLAERKGVCVRLAGAADLPAFYQLMQTTSRRDGFGIHPLPYYRAAFELFAPQRAALLLAEVAGEPVAGLMVFAHGPTACYLFGASSDTHREKMPAYLAQWAAIRWARQHGCTHYDLWGIPDCDEATLEARFADHSARRRPPSRVPGEPQGALETPPISPGEGLWGVYRFKRGFGGQVVRASGAFDYVYIRPLYWFYQRWLAGRWRGHGPTTGGLA
jgi:lipid II:glycine glycyltransferase (peptidoglycan interpeptide bridge formation enzyme)